MGEINRVDVTSTLFKYDREYQNTVLDIEFNEFLTFNINNYENN